MRTEILLTSETLVKSIINISDNVANKYLRPAILETQEVRLRGIVGDALFDKLIKVATRRLTHTESGDDVPYIDLLNRAQYFLAYAVTADLLPRISYKVANMGVVTTGDEKTQQVGMDDVFRLVALYQSKADSFAYQLQNFLLRNRDDYPELDECACHTIRATLHSSASCGIFLGGPRGDREEGYR